MIELFCIEKTFPRDMNSIKRSIFPRKKNCPHFTSENRNSCFYVITLREKERERGGKKEKKTATRSEVIVLHRKKKTTQANATIGCDASPIKEYPPNWSYPRASPYSRLALASSSIYTPLIRYQDISRYAVHVQQMALYMTDHICP